MNSGYKDKDLISIVVPVYNVEQYLEECANSILNQTYKNIEVIFINDGSTDGSLCILERLKETDSRIRIISKENTGYGDSVNIGMDSSVGEYFCIVEPDDYIELDMLEKFYSYMVQYSLDVLKTDYRWFIKGNNGYCFTYGKTLADKYTSSYYKVLDRDDYDIKYSTFSHTWAGMYKLKFINEYNIRHNPSKGASYQDNGFWFQTTMYAKRLMFINEAYYNLRRDNPNSSVYSKDKVFAMSDEYDFIREKIKEANIENKKELFQISFVYRYGNYTGRMNIMDSKYMPDFYDRMAKDFKTALELGEIDATRIEFDKWNYIYSVLNGEPPHKPGKLALPTSFSPEAVAHLYCADNLYIYGSGAYGTKLLNALKKAKLDGKIKGWIVSKSEDNTDSYMGLPVIEADQFDWRKGAVVILAMNRNIASEVLEDCRRYGYRISMYFTGDVLERCEDESIG